MFNKTLDNIGLTQYILGQLQNLIPDGSQPSFDQLHPHVNSALKRAEHCFSCINNKYFFDGKDVHFNHLHTDQYAMFLYLLSNSVWQESQDEVLASKIYVLNKALHSVDIFYQVEMPDIFLLVHPVGTVLGRATYKDYFVAYQRVTIGGNTNLEYPNLGEGLAVYGGSAIIGDCTISDNVLVAVGTTLVDKDIQGSMVVFEKDGSLAHKLTSKSVKERYFFTQK